MNFVDREQAAELLAVKLRKFSVERPVVLAIPRGAVPLGKIIAENLGADLDVILVRKLGAPGNPEYALGAVSEFGEIYIRPEQEEYLSQAYLKEVIERERDVIKKRRLLYTPYRSPIAQSGRTVILVDDGIATGATMLSAVKFARAAHAKKIVVAAPVVSFEAAEELRKVADECVFLEVSKSMWAISQFYEDFRQITDDEVCETLNESGRGVA